MGELGELRELKDGKIERWKNGRTGRAERTEHQSVIVAEMLVVQGLGDDADELVGDVVGEEITEVHDGSVILAREPRLFFALSFSADVAFITSWNLLAGAIVLPKTVFKKSLGESYFNKAPVSTDG